MQDHGTGKTAIGLNIAQFVAQKKNVYFACLEMNEIQIMNRIIAYYTDINSQTLRNATIENNEYSKIASNTDRITGLKMKIDTKVRYVEDLEADLRLLKYKDELDLVVIDYLTLLKSKNKYASRELEVAEISRRLKLMALELNIPVIVLVQLNRDAENKEPTMANIRESGTIEQNCDNIIFLHNPNAETQNQAVSDIEIILAKQRQGTTGKFEVTFDKRYSKFISKEI